MCNENDRLTATCATMDSLKCNLRIMSVSYYRIPFMVSSYLPKDAMMTHYNGYIEASN